MKPSCRYAKTFSLLSYTVLWEASTGFVYNNSLEYIIGSFYLVRSILYTTLYPASLSKCLGPLHS